MKSLASQMPLAATSWELDEKHNLNLGDFSIHVSQRATVIFLPLHGISNGPDPVRITISKDDKTRIIFFATCYSDPKWSNKLTTAPREAHLKAAIFEE